jgi:hypothetical protein
VPKNPDPALVLTTITGTSHTLDDWVTVFHLVLVCLPGRPEAAPYAAPGRELLRVFRGADCRTGFLVQGSLRQAQRVIGPAIDDSLVFLDDEGEFVKSAGLARLPALVDIGLDGSIVSAVEGWDPSEWTVAAKELAKTMSWSYPVFASPSRFEGWAT